jgi:hypothetical protein
MARSQDYPHDRSPEFKIHTAASARNITGPSSDLNNKGLQATNIADDVRGSHFQGKPNSTPM